MTVGMSHTGKTSFWCKLSKNNNKFVCLDTDTFVIFAKQQYENIFKESYSKRDFDNPNMKVAYQKFIINFCNENNFFPIISNCNIYKDFRKKRINYLQNLDYKIIQIYFDLPINLIKKRNLTTFKSKDALIKHNNYYESFQEQLKIFEAPDQNEANHFFHITHDDQKSNIIEKILKLVS